ncbi:hypothetical protein DFH11DRAFT_1543792 [Phellopilus nigrolimitatus]|nr:hypothetical protein DFH11DRAFT_1543792 [Phellopilus nigrolimitatus]
MPLGSADKLVLDPLVDDLLTEPALFVGTNYELSVVLLPERPHGGGCHRILGTACWKQLLDKAGQDMAESSRPAFYLYSSRQRLSLPNGLLSRTSPSFGLCGLPRPANMDDVSKELACDELANAAAPDAGCDGEAQIFVRFGSTLFWSARFSSFVPRSGGTWTVRRLLRAVAVLSRSRRNVVMGPRAARRQPPPPGEVHLPNTCVVPALSTDARRRGEEALVVSETEPAPAISDVFAYRGSTRSPSRNLRAAIERPDLHLSKSSRQHTCWVGTVLETLGRAKR